MVCAGTSRWYRIITYHILHIQYLQRSSWGWTVTVRNMYIWHLSTNKLSVQLHCVSRWTVYIYYKKVNFLLWPSTKDIECSRVSSSLSLNPGLDSGGLLTPRPFRFTPYQRDTLPIVQDNEWVPVPVPTGAAYFFLTWIRTQNRPESRDLLYRLS